MRRKIMVFVDDDGYKVKMKWLWKKMWLRLTEGDQEELDKVFNKMYNRYCEIGREQNKKKKEKEFKTGDRVIIHCDKQRKLVDIELFDGKVGTVEAVWDNLKNPWGNIVVRTEGGFNNAFHANELEKEW